MTPGELPPVFPVVLYNGDEPWNAATAMDELVRLPEGSPLRRWQPAMRYHLLDEQRFPKDALTKKKNLVAVLFALEQCREPQETLGLLDELIELLEGEEHRELKRAFSAWIRQILEVRVGGGVDARRAEELSEMRAMLANHVDEWKAKLRQEGMAIVVVRNISRRFGAAVAEQAGPLLVNASTEQLEAVDDRTFAATSGEELLAAIPMLVGEP